MSLQAQMSSLMPLPELTLRYSLLEEISQCELADPQNNGSLNTQQFARNLWGLQAWGADMIITRNGTEFVEYVRWTHDTCEKCYTAKHLK